MDVRDRSPRSPTPPPTEKPSLPTIRESLAELDKVIAEKTSTDTAKDTQYADLDKDEDEENDWNNFKPQKGQRWPEKLEEKLCQLWEEEKQLYACKAGSYKYAGRERRQAVQRIATKLNMEYDHVETHMNTMRTAYTKALKKPSGSGVDASSAKNKRILSICHFLRKHVKPRDGMSNLEKLDEERQNENDNEVESSQPVMEIDDTGDFVESCAVPEEKDDSEEKNNDKAPVKATMANRKKKGAKNNNENPDFMSTATSCLSTVQKVLASTGPQQVENVDQHELWGKLMAMKLRGMPPNEAEKFKLKMDQLAFEIMERSRDGN